MFGGIRHPEMVALRVGIGDMRAAHLLYFFAQSRVRQDGQTQILPILALAPGDHIVNGRQAQLLMIKVPVYHGIPAFIPPHPTVGVNSI
jgi:hypothetical protein